MRVKKVWITNVNGVEYELGPGTLFFVDGTNVAEIRPDNEKRTIRVSYAEITWKEMKE